MYNNARLFDTLSGYLGRYVANFRLNFLSAIRLSRSSLGRVTRKAAAAAHRLWFRIQRSSFCFICYSIRRFIMRSGVTYIL